MQAQPGGKFATIVSARPEARGGLSDIAIRLLTRTVASMCDPHSSGADSYDPGDTH